MKDDALVYQTGLQNWYTKSVYNIDLQTRLQNLKKTLNQKKSSAAHRLIIGEGGGELPILRRGEQRQVELRLVELWRVELWRVEVRWDESSRAEARCLTQIRSSPPMSLSSSSSEPMTVEDNPATYELVIAFGSTCFTIKREEKMERRTMKKKEICERREINPKDLILTLHHNIKCNSWDYQSTPHFLIG